MQRIETALRLNGFECRGTPGVDEFCLHRYETLYVELYDHSGIVEMWNTDVSNSTIRANIRTDGDSAVQWFLEQLIIKLKFVRKTSELDKAWPRF